MHPGGFAVSGLKSLASIASISPAPCSCVHARTQCSRIHSLIHSARQPWRMPDKLWRRWCLRSRQRSTSHLVAQVCGHWTPSPGCWLNFFRTVQKCNHSAPLKKNIWFCKSALNPHPFQYLLFSYPQGQTNSP